MKNIDILITAAGKGTRSKLDYPKSLYKIGKKSILVRLITDLSFIKRKKILIVSKCGKSRILSHLKKRGIKVNYIVQNKQLGMGDAIYTYARSKLFNIKNNTLLIWGDLLFLSKRNILHLITNHFKNNNTLSFISGYEKNPYTIVKRSRDNKVLKVEEIIELKSKPNFGERDIGIFLFNNKKIKSHLLNKKNYEIGKKTKEIKFLSVIKHLVLGNKKVEAYPIASKKEMISFNYPKDIKLFNRLNR
jgi:bifunctional N-acetylglucosamine-1-phosphate-uridyltransferase/glucosamine-1-phosphate-acetyltransferase GlmU-like protein